MDSGQIIELVTLLVLGAGSLSAVVWKLLKLIGDVDDKRSAGIRDLHKKIDDTATSLDVKFNTVRDEIGKVKEDYVRRDDLNALEARIGKSFDATTAAVDRLRVRFDESFVKMIDLLATGKKT